METKVCCICGKEIKGWGNNPYGALDNDLNIIEWKEDAVCCDACNNKYVISGRLYTMAQVMKKDMKGKDK